MPKKSATKKIDPAKRMKDANQERFCFLYSSGASQEHFGNATKSYSAAYGYEARISKAEEELTEIPYNKDLERKKKRREIQSMLNTCRSNGSKLLTNTNIIARSDYILGKLYSEEEADKELAYVMKQRKDLQSKTAAIREYNRVKNRVQEKIQGEVTVRWATPEEMKDRK